MSSDSAHNNKSRLAILFLTLFLDLVGFSIIFPLFPAMLITTCQMVLATLHGWVTLWQFL